VHRFTIPLDHATLQGESREGGGNIVFIHGFGGSLHGWNQLWAAMPPSLGLTRYDLRGFGRSSAEEGASFSHVDDLLALLDARGIGRATLVGLSMGGGIAAGFALDHPDRVEKLVLISPALMGWEWTDEWRQLWRAMAKAARSGNMAKARRLWWQHPLFASTRASPAAEELRQEIEVFAGRQWIRDDQLPVLPDVERLHLIAAPTLLLTGALDFADFRLMGDVLEAAVPGIRRIDFPDAGHMLDLEKAQQIAQAIAEFVAA
jgi:pimeloyl-ACP methyl ester carboxylesterase